LDWKAYEQEVKAHFLSEYPSARIQHNVKIPGKLSKVERQIDVLIEQELCDLSFTIVIDAKRHKRKIDVKDIEEFIGLVRDVGAHKGVMISTEGYTTAAITRAHADDADVILDVLNFKQLPEYAGLAGIPYSVPHGVVVQPPFGWIVDGRQGRGALAFLYERGRTFEDANKAREFMYVNFWKKKEPIANLETLFKHQEEYMRQGMNPADEIKYIDGVKRGDGHPSAIRTATFVYHPGLMECTGFVDFGEFIFMCVLFTREEQSEKNLGKLRFMMRKAFPMAVSKKESPPQTAEVD
jgi:hypothetical protein